MAGLFSVVIGLFFLFTLTVQQSGGTAEQFILCGFYTGSETNRFQCLYQAENAAACRNKAFNISNSSCEPTHLLTECSKNYAYCKALTDDNIKKECSTLFGNYSIVNSTTPEVCPSQQA
ncbi:hypothetical protein BY458DRAFT_486392 [Sporodiniella umbellata]|nr:hypothetical protein BY458DRAFT_486392 [Sporodiniella umbellata]